VLSHLKTLRPAVILLPVATACSARSSGSVIQAGRPVPTTARTAAVVLPTAERYIGVKYKWGGESPKTGFDCSGYTQFVFARHGVKLPRTSRSQALVGQQILDYRALRAGDLIMFAENGKPISHVAIFAGRDRIIHSSSSGKGVRYDDLRSQRGTWFRNHMVVARRVAPAVQGLGIVRDLVSELRSQGIRVDYPAIADAIGDLAPKP
jgi:cell wall-associated NlpC family hydrolase